MGDTTAKGLLEGALSTHAEVSLCLPFPVLFLLWHAINTHTCSLPICECMCLSVCVCVCASLSLSLSLSLVLETEPAAERRMWPQCT